MFAAMFAILRYLFFPFSLVYALVMAMRNCCYNWGWFKSTSFNKPVICVGNLAVGGSGKTPTVEYLVRLLATRRIAILSRGYGRKTTGFILADDTATASSIGDEPLQYYHKFPNVTVAVCEDRVAGINKLIGTHDVVLLDDAYQHRAVKAGFNILLFDYDRITKPQWFLPTGSLREPFLGYRRAQQILITKCPALSPLEKGLIVAKFKHRKDSVSFAKIAYGSLVHLFSKQTRCLEDNTAVFLLTGIANAKPLATHLKNNLVKHYNYPDHYQFKLADITTLVADFKASATINKIVVTTEKDGQRLLSGDLRDLLLNLPIYYQPIQVQLDAGDKETFDQKILAYVAKA